MAKADKSKVNKAMARAARDRAKDRAAAFSEYVRLHYQSTGCLAPGCDAKDFYAVYDELNVEENHLEMPEDGLVGRRWLNGSA